MTAHINYVPIGGGRRYLVLCDGQPIAGYDMHAQAQSYIAMQRGKATACPKREETYACKREWTIRDTGAGA